MASYDLFRARHSLQTILKGNKLLFQQAKSQTKVTPPSDQSKHNAP